MRIVMVAARYLPFVGGIETHIHEVGTRMAGRGHRVTVLTTDPTGTLPAQEMSDGMRVRRVAAWPRHRDYYFAPGVYREIVQTEADVVHFQGYNTFVAPIGMYAAIRRDVPFVVTFHSGGHSSRLRNAIRRLQHGLLAPLVARAPRLVAVSEYEAEFFSRRMGLDRDRFTVIPNGASLPPSSTEAAQGRGDLLVSIGRLERYKGHQRVITALPHLLRERPDARLKIIGSGPYEAELRRLVRALNLEDVVSIESIPGVQRQRLSDLLAAARLVVLLSDYEAHPVAVMEALSLRRPVLVTDTSGLGELARKGLCRAIPLHADAATVAVAIAEELAADRRPPDIRLPDWDTCTRQLIGVYEDVVNGAGGRRLNPNALAPVPVRSSL